MKETIENTLTPMMRQYQAIKKDHKDGFLFFRLGDFYEMFFEDALEASKILNITLTAREAGKGNRVPMCGVPYHAADGYIAKLIRQGKKVFICEQTEDPRFSKGIVKREITEVITPGTVLDAKVLDEKKNNYLVSVCFQSGNYGVAVADLSTGEFRVTEIKDKDSVKNELFRLSPAELLLPKTLAEDPYMKNFSEYKISTTVTALDDWIYEFNTCYRLLTEHFRTASLDGFGCQGMIPGISAAGTILHYLQENLYETLHHIDSLQFYSTENFMLLDENTMKNLEILESFSKRSDSTLLGILDHTVTAMGGRLLRKWLSAPLLDKKETERRLDAVEDCLENFSTIQTVRQLLKKISDIERIVGKISSQRANGRDLVGLKISLRSLPEIRTSLMQSSSLEMKRIREELQDFNEEITLLENAIEDNPPLSIKDGGVIKKDFHGGLKELKDISRSSRKRIAEIQAGERERTGIKSLKINFNKVFGYYIEITKANLPSVPQDYIRKQTLVNSERYITPELKELEDKILGADEKIKNLEYEIFQDIRSTISQKARDIKKSAHLVAHLDAYIALATSSRLYGYTRPEVDESDTIEIIDGRHPVVERLLRGEAFIPNSITLDGSDNQIALITGPNMAGKSTFIRQVALITLMAQVGSFVPAAKARIGLVDRIFTRVGASDDLAAGKSTFMIEMNETALILNNATSKSLIVLDEIGRGTSTYDGISIAWSVAEHLHINPHKRAKTLFATHYFELTKLEDIFEGVKNYNIAVSEWNEDII
ncbi:MAG: DNA mismatch repair protein MutS, partial [Candidatus Aureabacteria bacterium]|nr:DNA mismatch repair protein MutS [Candidatus Auribacterota bacterium]